MTELDLLIYRLAIAGLIVSLFRRQALMAAVLLCLSFLFDQAIFIERPRWYEIQGMYFSYALKDLCIAIVFLFSRRTMEVALGLLFAISSLVSQIIYIQVDNEVFYLFDNRTAIVSYISAAQIAIIWTLILSKESTDGGKRAKHSVYSSDHIVYDFFCLSSRKNQEEL